MQTAIRLSGTRAASQAQWEAVAIAEHQCVGESSDPSQLLEPTDPFVVHAGSSVLNEAVAEERQSDPDDLTTTGVLEPPPLRYEEGHEAADASEPEGN